MIINVLGYLAVVLFISQEVIPITNGETDGRWGSLETCPAGSRAVSHQNTNEADASIVDD